MGEMRNHRSQSSSLSEDSLQERVRRLLFNVSQVGRKRRRVEGRRLWLDCTPPEVLTIIAAHVATFGQTQDVLHFAETGERQANAVTVALSKGLRLTEGSTCNNMTRWAEVFRNKVEDLALDRSEDISTGELTMHKKPGIVKLLGAPTLRSARIFNEAAFLFAAVQSKALRSLDIEIYDRTPHDLLFSTLSNLKLDKLSLSCFCTNCLFQDTRYFGQWNALAQSSPGLLSLEIYCECWRECGEINPIWRLIPELPCLEEVTLNDDASEYEDAVVPILLNLRSVKIDFRSRAFRLASMLPQIVTELSQKACLRASQVEQLPGFYNLKRLDVEIPEGSTGGWLHLLESFSSLEALHLRWTLPEGNHDSPCFEGKPCYSNADEGILLHIANNAPNLTELSLLYVTLSLEEMLSILKVTGQRLKVFVTSLQHQQQLPALRLEALMHAVIAHNPELLRFSVVDKSLSEPSRQAAAFLTDMSSCKRVGRRLIATLRRLHQQLPLLDSLDVRVFISTLLETPEEAFH